MRSRAAASALAAPLTRAACLPRPSPRSAATSWDGAHPPEHAIDGDDRTFWVTTGMFPQELVITLGARAQVSRVVLRSVGIRRLSILGCAAEQPGAYEALVPERELADCGRGQQSEVFELRNSEARHVKLVIHAGWDHIVAVNSLQIEGQKR